MSSDANGVLSEILARGPVRDLSSGGAWLDAMLETEVALARCAAGLGLMPPAHAEAIERAVRTLVLDVEGLARDAALTGTPVLPLVEQIRAAVADAEVARSVHFGATSQDIVDTASMLVAHRSLAGVIEDLAGAATAAANLARAHRATPIIGRTLLQQAVPTTFGLKAAGWMTGLDRAIDGLVAVRAEALAVQLGGGAGTLAPYQGDGRRLVVALAAELGLRAPIIPWHSDRTRIGQVAGAVGVAAGAVAKIARDVILLAQTEVGEVAEGVAGRGGSSAFPDKHNPIAAVSALASARRVPGGVSTLLSVMDHEHERAAGSWHAEWLPLLDILVAAGSAGAWLRDSLEHLDVRPEVMRRNLEMARARAGVGDAARDPAAAVGEAEALVGDALRAHDERSS